MKRITALSFVGTALMLCGLLTFNSCSKDACKDVTCSANGTTTTVGSTCTCTCNDGYFGTGCSLAFNSPAIGNWRVTNETTREQGTTTDVPTDAYTDSIIAGATATKITINNFSAYAAPATLNADTSHIFQATTDTFSTTYNDGSNNVTVKIYNFNGTYNTARTEIQYTYNLTTNVGAGAGTNFSATGKLVKQ